MSSEERDVRERKTITKKQVVDALARKHDIHPNEVRTVVQGVLDALLEALSRGDRIEFRDFGIFEVVKRKQKVGRNPRRADIPVVIPERNVVKFTPGRYMKRLVEEEMSVEESS